MATVPTGTFEHTLEEIDAAVSEVESTKGTETSLTAAIEEIAGTSATTAAQSAVSTAIGALDASSKGGTGKYIKEISETDGVISATAETMDTTPTASSTKAVTSGGVKTYVDAETTARQAECNVLANAGAKNVSKAVFTSGTNNGVTFSANSDGTVTANSTGTQSQNATLQSTTFLLKAGTYTFSCSPNPQRDVTYDSYLYDTDNSRSIARDNPNDSPTSTFTLSVDTNVRINLRVNKTYTANNLIFSPMIRHAEITDATYQPYAPTNRELYEMILALQ